CVACHGVGSKPRSCARVPPGPCRANGHAEPRAKRDGSSEMSDSRVEFVGQLVPPVIIVFKDFPFTQPVPADDKRFELWCVIAQQVPKQAGRSEVCSRWPRHAVMYGMIVILANLITPEPVDVRGPPGRVVGCRTSVW